MYFSDFRRMDLNGIPVWITRTGYTGEDGFEISVPNERAMDLTEAIMADPLNRLCGLGPRDRYHPKP
jgi:aminomethyltransferase